MDAQLATWLLTKLGNAALILGFAVLIGSGGSLLTGSLIPTIAGMVVGLLIAGVTLRDADARVEVPRRP
jgi:hypothetical protein